MNRRQKDSERKKLLTDFRTASSVDDKIKTLQNMERVYEESELAFEYCLYQYSNSKYIQNPFNKVLVFGRKALKIFIANANTNTPCSAQLGNDVPCTHQHKQSLFIAYTCNIMAAASLRLPDKREVSPYLKWAKTNLDIMKDKAEERCCSNCVLDTLAVNRLEMCNYLRTQKKYVESLVPLKEAFKIYESILPVDSLKWGQTNRYMCVSHMDLSEYKEALPFCLTAIRIYSKNVGPSLEMEDLKKRLADLYAFGEEFAKALKVNSELIGMLKLRDPNSAVLLERMHVQGNTLIGLSKYSEALVTLKEVVNHSNTPRAVRAFAFVSMAKASSELNKLTDAKKYLETAKNVLGAVEDDEINVLKGYKDIALLYEEMGGKYVVVLDDLELGVECMERAKHFLERAIGPRHFDSLSLGHLLAGTYLSMEKYDVAMEIQEKVVQDSRGLVPPRQAFLDEAVSLLDQIKERKKSLISTS